MQSASNKIAQPTWIYLIGHYGPSLPSTHINSSGDPFAALDAHNGGRERETRKAAGQWQILLLICVPPTRQIDVPGLVHHWRHERRTIHHRLVYGIRLAAELMLLCFTSREPLLKARASDTKTPRTLLDKVLAQVESQSGESGELNRELIRTRVSLYLERPSVVYAQRHGSEPLIGDDGALTREFLDEINTLKNTKQNATCFSTNVSGGKRTAEQAAEEEEEGDEEGEDEDDEDNEKEKSKTTQTTAKRAKKLMTIVNGLVGLQQSNAFNDLASAIDANDALAQSATADVGTGKNQSAARRRQRNPLFSAQGVIDKHTVRQYADALCVDMRSKNTLANMKIIAGQSDRRCICGTPRLTDSDSVDIVLMPHAKPLAAYRCTACGRFSAAYERYCIDAERTTKLIRPPGSDKRAAGNGTASLASSTDESSADSLDLFLQTLLVSFSDGSPEQQQQQAAVVQPAPVLKRANVSSTRRRRLFDVPAAPVEPVPAVQQDNIFMYGNRSVMCRHASLTPLDVPHDESALIESMLSAAVK